MADYSHIRWTLPSKSGIQTNEAANAWNSGHITDIVHRSDNPTLTVATETGGVWLVQDSGDSLPLSDSWDNPDTSCLAVGPDGPMHVVAGCTDRYQQDVRYALPTIMESRADISTPLLDWVPTNPLPTGSGTIAKIVVNRLHRLIVVACSNEHRGGVGGLFWARIPEWPDPDTNPPVPRGAYDWKAALIESPPPDGFTGLAIASTVDGLTVDDLEDLGTMTVVAGGRSEGIWVGQWTVQPAPDGGVALTLAPAHLNATSTSTDLHVASRTSIACCASKPTVLYAASARPDGTLQQILRSADGGYSWDVCGALVDGAPLQGVAQSQGADWNNVVAVAPYDPTLIALGWQAGTFLSTDAGESWKWVNDGAGHLHPDVHALVFTGNAPGYPRTLLIGSDGGLASVDLDHWAAGDAAAYRSDYNQELPTLQVATPLIRQFYGGLDASRFQPGLVGMGLQDNGCVYARLNATPTPWKAVDGGDGMSNIFLVDGTLIHHDNGQRTQATKFDDPATIRSTVDIELLAPQTPGGVAGIGTAPVVQPSHRNANRQLLVAATAISNVIYGLFAADDLYHWEVIPSSIPSDLTVSAVHAHHGGSIFAGTTETGRAFVIDVTTGQTLELPLRLPKAGPTSPMTGGSFIRFASFSETDVFALLVGATAQSASGLGVVAHQSYVLKLEALNWVPVAGLGLPGTFMYGLTAITPPDPDWPRGLAVSTDDAVYISSDDGSTWRKATKGLPQRPHCGELRSVTDNDGTTLYLGTYGRSVWTATLELRDE